MKTLISFCFVLLALVTEATARESDNYKSVLSGLVVNSIAEQKFISPPFDINRYSQGFRDEVNRIRNKQKALYPKVYKCDGDNSFSLQVQMNSILINNRVLLQNISDPAIGYFEFRNEYFYLIVGVFDTGVKNTIYYEDLKTNKIGRVLCEDFLLRLFDMRDAPSEVIKEIDKYNMKPGYFLSLRISPVNLNRDPLTLRPEPIVNKKTADAIAKVNSTIAKHKPKPWNYYGERTAKAIASCKKARSRGAVVNGGIGC